VSGEVVKVGENVHSVKTGQRVCVHYMITCGDCEYCQRGMEQFCTTGKMIGKHRDGGYAEYIVVPSRSVFALPDEISYPHGAILMCSSATSLHALVKARIKAGETVAVFGIGGLGISAIQIARAFGALKIFAVDLNEQKLKLAERLGAIPVDARSVDPVNEIRKLTRDKGVDVGLELVGSPVTGRQALQSVSIGGRVALAGLTQASFEVFPYTELIGVEAELIGVSDHLAQEIPFLLNLLQSGKLDLTPVVTRIIPLEAQAINLALDRLEAFSEDLRVVIEPG
jgi:D-arabinose 1-dehydrogenase-like Zn-dependent alcohol dehydrogenase